MRTFIAVLFYALMPASLALAHGAGGAGGLPEEAALDWTGPLLALAVIVAAIAAAKIIKKSRKN